MSPILGDTVPVHRETGTFPGLHPLEMVTTLPEMVGFVEKFQRKGFQWREEGLESMARQSKQLVREGSRYTGAAPKSALKYVLVFLKIRY